MVRAGVSAACLLTVAGCAITSSTEVPGAVPATAPPANALPSVSAPARPDSPVLSAADNPFAGRQLYGGHSAAADAALATAGRSGELLARLAAVPTATWLLPENHPVGVVGPVVADVVAAADVEGGVPVFVVYGMPDRDCESGFSKGGLPASQYVGWVREIGDAAGPSAVVILEPDALASAERCARPDERFTLLSDAIGVLAGGPSTYVDIGHSGWLDETTAVSHLRRVGVDRVRGFALNVAGHGFEQEEAEYGRALVAGLGDGHFVVDTSRAGAGSDGQWCNAEGRALGAVPGVVPGPGPWDARLWVKPPGESDGTCGGGPPAGEFWPERALALARAAGW